MNKDLINAGLAIGIMILLGSALIRKSGKKKK